MERSPPSAWLDAADGCRSGVEHHVDALDDAGREPARSTRRLGE